MSIKQDLYDSEDLYAWISKRAAALEEVIMQKEAALGRYPKDLPERRIRIILNGKKHKNEQFYWLGEGCGKSGNYIKKGELSDKIIQDLVQREYDEKSLKAAKKEYSFLKKGKKFASKNPLVAVYDSMGVQKQKRLDPVILSDSAYIKKWMDHKTSSDYRPENKLYVTKQKECVRSKSELLIANALYDHNVPYHYECSSNRQDLQALPDFTVLNVRKKKEYLWEHFGMMDNPDYCAHTMKKIRNYEKHNIFPGQSIIYTFESSELPLDTNTIESMIQIYLL